MKKQTRHVARLSLRGAQLCNGEKTPVARRRLRLILAPQHNGAPAGNEESLRPLAKHPIESRWRRLSRGVRWAIIILALLLISVRLMLPFLVKNYVNRQLGRLSDYHGRVQSVDLHLWRGAYRIRGIQIDKTGGAVPVPFFSASNMDLALQWRELAHGKIVGKILLAEPELNFVSGPTDKESQLGTNQPWETTVESFYPFDINAFEIKKGKLHFRNFVKEQPVDIYLTNFALVATNLTNARDKNQKLPAGITAQADTLGNGKFTLEAHLAPLEKGPTYELNATLTNVDMVALNDFLRSYAKVDVAKGNFSMFTSVASADGNYKGFVKVLFRNLEVFAWEKERKKNILEIFWEAIVGTLATGFKNHPHDQLATQIPISGSYTNSHVGLISAVGNLLQNAFVRALLPSIGKPVHVQDVEKKPSPSAPNQTKPEPAKASQLELPVSR